jgi:hypothetical protein
MAGLNLLFGMSTMDALDALQGSMGMVYGTIDGRRYKLGQITKFKASMEISKKEVPILGRTTKGNKPGGIKNSFEGSMYYNAPMFRKMLIQYQDTGKLPTFDVEIYNDDPQAPHAGIQAVVLLGCMIDGGVVAQVDATAEFLEEDIKGTFDKALIPKHFNVHPFM